MFAGSVPSLSIQYGSPSGLRDISGLVDLINRGADLLVLDTRIRHCSHGCTIKQALNDLEVMHRKFWARGAVEQHLTSTIAFLHDGIFNIIYIFYF